MPDLDAACGTCTAAAFGPMRGSDSIGRDTFEDDCEASSDRAEQRGAHDVMWMTRH